MVTTFIFRVRNVPAALYKALGGFATNGVNMTKLESYQLEGSFNATMFYADVEGHPSGTPLRLALEELEFHTAELIVLGTYPASPFRETLKNRNGKGTKRRVPVSLEPLTGRQAKGGYDRVLPVSILAFLRKGPLGARL